MYKCWGEAVRGVDNLRIHHKCCTAMYKCYGEPMRDLHHSGIHRVGLLQCVSVAVNP